jgi:hypothetical protein
MTTRISNQKFITVLDPLPLDGIGWEAVAYHVQPDGGLSVMQRVYRATEMTGSKVRNDFGSGTIVIPKDDVLWDLLLPTPLTGGDPLDREFLWQFYEDGVLRHEFFGEDINENIAVEDESPRTVTIGGRTTEVVMGWGVHVPAWAEIQDVTLDDSAETGGFILKFGSGRTQEIPHDATAAQFEAAAVAGISGLSADDIEVTKKIEDGQRKWSIKFVGKYIVGNLVAPGFALKSSTAEAAPGEGGVQVVALTTAANSGTFVLEFGNDASTPIAFNASAADFKAAIVTGVSAITNADINVTRSVVDDVIKWRVEYVGAFIGVEGVEADPEAEPPVEAVEGVEAADNPGLALKSSSVGSGTAKYFPSVSGLASGGTAKYAPSVSDITQIDFYASDEPQKAIKVFLDCLARCQDRDIVPYLVPLFDTTVDSFGEAWIDDDVQELSPGETLLSLLQRFSEAYGWEFRMLPGFRLQVSQTGFGLNRSDEVRFWLGGHQLNHTLSRTTRELLTRVWAQTDTNFIVQAEGVSSATELKRETWLDGFEGDSSFAQAVANKTRTERAGQAKERAVKFPYNVDDKHRLFDDFNYCDFVGVEDDRNVMHILKIESVSWKVGAEAPIDFEVTFLGE